MTNNPYAVVMGDLNLIRCFSLSEVPYLPVATTTSSLIFHSRAAMTGIKITDPLISTNQAKNDLIRLAGNQELKPVLFYSNDQQLLMISEYRDELSKYFRFCMPSAELVTACVDKQSFIQLCIQYQLPLPYTYKKSEVLQPGFSKTITYPCIIKPTTRYLWRINGVDPEQKVILVDSPTKLDNLISSIESDKDYVVQQFIPGNDDLIYSYHAFHDANGKSLGKYCGRKLRCKPLVNGYSSSVTLVENDYLMSIGDEIVKKLSLYGPIKIDFKYNKSDEKYYLLEINPRFNMWHYLGMICGINLPKNAFLYLTNHPTTVPVMYKTNIKWLNFRRDFIAGLEAYKTKQIGLFEWLKTYATLQIYDTFSWRDPVPAIVGFRLFIQNRIRSLFK